MRIDLRVRGGKRWLIVVDRGRIMAEGSPQALIRQYSTREVLELRFGSDRNAEVLSQLADLGDRQEVLPDRILLYADDGEALPLPLDLAPRRVTWRELALDAASR